MANALGTLFGDIASAIREKTGDTATMKPAQFPEKIAAIEAGGSGGGSLPPGGYWEVLNLPRPTNYYNIWIELDGTLYAFSNTTNGNGYVGNVYKFNSGSWTSVVTNIATYVANPNRMCFVKYNGRIHMLGGNSKKHYVFNGTSFTKKNDVPNNMDYQCAFVQDGKLKSYSYSDKKVYVWNETADSWTVESTISTTNTINFINIDGVIYSTGNKIYRNGELVDSGFSKSHYIGNYECVTIGKKHYYKTTSGNMIWVKVSNFGEDVGNQEVAILPNYNSNGTVLFEYEGSLCAMTCANGGDVGNAMPMKLHEVTE